MRLFEPIYHRMMLWARHRHAPTLLTLFSTAEAVFFPVPPEVMLAPMCLAEPKRGFGFATLSLAGSMVGAVIGYALGHFAYELMIPVFDALGWQQRIDAQVTRLREIAAQSPWQAFWLLVLAGFTPIPLKIFTWAAGIVGVPFLPFLASMFIGRGKRVYLLAGAIRVGGARAERLLAEYIEHVGWFVTAVLGLGLLWLAWHLLAG